MLTVPGVERPVSWKDGLTDWKQLSGQWSVDLEDGQPALVKRGSIEPFNVIVAPSSPCADLDATVMFKPISGREDASGGIVFRFSEGRYYVIRANALENNFRLYSYDRTRRQLASARTTPPELAAWNSIRVVAVGDRIQGYLNGNLLIDHQDAQFASGHIGLWTKADSVSAFQDFTMCGGIHFDKK
jgi:hypothetical protein